MRLNENSRRAIQNAVRNDIPQPMNAHYLQVQKEVVEIMVSRLPEKVRAVYADQNLRGYLAVTSWLDGYGGNLDITFPKGCTLTEDLKARLEKARELACEERSTIYHTMQLLAQTLKGCQTTTALLKIMPELEPYMPAEATTVKDLPASVVASELSKLGWPKGKEDDDNPFDVSSDRNRTYKGATK